jgi:hypothetical protein
MHNNLCGACSQLISLMAFVVYVQNPMQCTQQIFRVAVWYAYALRKRESLLHLKYRLRCRHHTHHQPAMLALFNLLIHKLLHELTARSDFCSLVLLLCSCPTLCICTSPQTSK